MERRPRMRRGFRAILGFGVMILAVAVGTGIAHGAPGVPEAPIQRYLENFENGIGNGAGDAQGVHTSANSAPSYTGANGETYSAATDWRNGNRCNGIVMSYNNSTLPSWAAPPNTNRCGQAAFGSYYGVRSIARAMGQFNGTGDNEHIVSSYSECDVTRTDTAGACPTIGSGATDGIMFRTSENLITTVPGRYYRMGVDVIHANCDSPNSTTVQSNDPRYQLRLRTGPNAGDYTTIGGEINACRPNSARTQLSVNKPQGGAPMTAFGLRYLSEAVRYTGSQMGLSLHNNTGATGGNDGGFDNVRILDVTPSLDKSFSPSPIPVGGTSTLTFTITNTTDLLAKPDWSFTDTLPTGVVVANPAGIGGTCVQASGTTAFTRTATPGSNTITVAGGDLTAGMTSCTITVNVTAANPGTYTNGPANVTSPLIPPDPAQLQVLGSWITLTKTAGEIVDANGNGIPDAGDAITYSFVVTNNGNAAVTGLSVTDPLFGTVTCGVPTLAAGETRPCTPRTYTLTQADVEAGVRTNTATATGTVYGVTVTSNSSTSTPIPSTPRIAVDKTAGAINDLDSNGDDAGDTIVYSFVVTNTGNRPLTSIAISDPKVGSISCPPASALAPGASRICNSATYTLTQDDVNAGVVNNTATVTGTPPTGSAVIGTDSTSTSIPPSPAIAIVKTAGPIVDVDGNGPDAGDTIAYMFAVRNAGNVTLNSIAVSDPLVGPVTCPPGPLSPGATVNCVAGVYTITQADVDAGVVDNTATASGTPPTGGPVTGSGSATRTITRTPALTFDKAIGGGIVDVDGNGPDAGDTIAYTFTIQNTGNVTLTSVTVSDPKVGPVTCPPGPLAPGATASCTAAPYVLTQADVDAGAVNNTATASGTPPSGPPITQSDTTSTAIVSAPGIQLTKATDGVIVDPDGNGPDAGDMITYTFTIRNTGNVTLDPVTVSDPKVGPVTCPDGPLAPGATVNCTPVTYSITQADVNLGAVVNSATASGTPPSGPAVTHTHGTSTPVPPLPSLVLDKVAGNVFDADGDGRQNAGDTITYTFTVTNTGNVTLNPVTVNDPTVGPVTCPDGPLDPGAIANCSAVYTLTQADVDAGAVNNTATASGTPPTGSPVTHEDSTSVTVPADLAISLDKAAGGGIVDVDDNGRVDAGDTITYTFAVTNMGTVTLAPVTVSDPKVGPVTCPAGSLAPQATVDCDPVTYTITQADIDAGVVANTATATGTPPSGPVATATDTVDIPVARTPVFTFDKVTDGTVVDANGSQREDAGDTIIYTFTIQNTGNVTLASVTVSDPKVGSVTCPPGSLAPGATVSCTAAPYVLTQDDVDAGVVDNTATASATAPFGPPITRTDSTSTPISQVPGIELTKGTDDGIVDADGNGPDAGDTITYTFAVRNAGNVTLDPVTVSDPMVGPVTCPPGSLAPGATVNCSAAPYVLTQGDVDAGVVDNTATASGTPPAGPAVTGEGSTTTPISQVSGIELTKGTGGGIVDVDDNGRVDAGDTITYTFAVRNAGNVTLNSIAVSDPKVGPVACPPGSLAPGAAVNCSAAPYVLTQGDLDAGEVTNTATASGTPPAGPAVTGEGSTTTPIARIPGVELTKGTDGGIVDVDDNGRVDAGDTITYTFAVRNAGNVTLASVTVSDPKVGAVTCPVGALASGATVNCSAAPYVLTQADVDAGEVVNTATVTGTAPGGATATDQDSTTTAILRTPRLVLDKATDGGIVDANGSLRPDAGDEITYTFTVRNAGNVTLASVTVSDPKVGPVTCPTGALAPGATVNCDAVVYVITQADVDDGAVENTATASGTPPAGPAVTSSDTTSTPIPPGPAITLQKVAGALVDADGNGPDAGDTITYTIAVTNAGNVTLDPVVVSDPMVGAVTCPAGPLVPGATMDCDPVVYTLTQADVDAGMVTNTATATGTTPTGALVTATGSTETPITPDPELRLTKTAGSIVDANGVNGVDAGDTITYTFAVTNAGNVTLDPVVVSDPMVGAVTCPAGPLVPGATMDCDPVVYTLTQADVDSGEVNNSATATGTPPSGPAVTDDDSTTTSITRSPAIALDKQAGPIVDANSDGRVDAGDTVSYAFVIRNAGNVTLNPVTVSDPMLGPVTCPLGPLAPGATVGCDPIAHTLTQADIDAGSVNNLATASGTPPSGPAVTATDGTSTAIPAGPDITLHKGSGGIVDTNVTLRPDAGDTITYTFAIENTGTVTLDSLTISDPMVGAVTCPPGPLAPGDTVDCDPVNYTITQADVDAGVVTNLATGSGTPPSGPVVMDDDSTTTSITRVSSLELTKGDSPVGDANANGRADAGETITYTFTVRNTGNVTLDPVTVSDPMVGVVTCPPGSLAPGASFDCDTATYALTQADIDAGVVDNIAVATGIAPNGDAATDDDSTTTLIPAAPAVGLDKQAGPIVDANANGRVDAGDTITYTFTVRNTGNVTLNPVSVSDPMVGAVTCPAGPLSPGATRNCDPGVYTLTQTDIDAGMVRNTATATGTPPTGDPVDGEGSVTTVVPTTLSIDLDKDAGPIVDANASGRQDAGDAITYTFTIRNTGNVTLDPVTLSDPKVGPVTCPSGPLAPGATRNCDPVVYTLTQADIDAGEVVNLAGVVGVSPSGFEVVDTATTTTAVTQEAGFTFDKEAGSISDANDNGRADAGETITYTFAVTNTGTVTLNPVTVSDPLVGPVTCPSGPLAPGATRNCDPVVYTLTQADIDDGVVNNTATATATPPSGPVLTEDDSTTTPIPAAPAVGLDKQAGPIVDANANGRVDAGDTITYTFTVRNTGNVTLDPVTVSDPMVGAVTCPSGPLAPGAIVDCDAVTYALTQGDVDAGVVDNVATASGTSPTGTVVTGVDSTTTPVATAPSVALDKQAGPIVDANANGRVDIGDTITYTFAIRNAGTVTLDPVTVSDPTVGPVTCPTGPLAPGATVDCDPVVHALTSADLDAGAVNNIATATGTPPSGDVVTSTDATSVVIPPDAGIVLDKQAGSIVDADGNGRVDAGDTITYTFAIRNSGTVTLDQVTVSDPMVGAVTCPAGPLGAGVIRNCDPVVYTLTQADIDAGEVVNLAGVVGVSPSGFEVVDTDGTTTSVPQVATISLDKGAGPVVDTNGTLRPDAGDTITYTFAVTNTGTVTLDPVTVSDPMLGTVTCPVGAVAPGATVNCGPVSYTLTQADVDAGVVTNSATASGTPPSGAAVTGSDSTTTTITPASAITLDKQAGPIVDANGSGRVDAGDTIVYTFTVRNAGNVTLNPVTVSDPKVGAVTCPPGPLAPGASVSCDPATYVLTQADVNAGQVTNTATASGTPPTGPAVTGDGTVTTSVPAVASLSLDKRNQVIDPAGDGPNPGDVIRYTFIVENTGTVTLDPVTVNDPMLGGAVTCPPGPLDPGETVTCGPADHTITQQNMDAGVVNNTATASGTPLTGPVVTGTDSTTTPLARTPEIALQKQAGPIVDANGNGRVDAGDTVAYTFRVTNTGNVTLNPVVIGDPMLGGAVSCPAGSLAAGAFVECGPVVHTLTQANVNAGQVVNQAGAVGVSPTGVEVVDTASTTTTITPAPAIALDKQAGPIVDANGNGRVDAGDTITYGFAIQNTGNVTLNPVTVSDPKVGAVTCPAGPLAPGGPVSCTAVVYTLTQDDIDTGAVNNGATASGRPPTGDAVSATDSTSTAVPASPAIALDKQAGPIVDANGSGRVDAGDTIAYTFRVTNTGTVSLTAVGVNDPMLGTVTCPVGEVAPGATVNCDAVVYALTQDDLDAGRIVNTATVSGAPPTGDPVTGSDTVTTTVPAVASLALDKQAGPIVDANGSGRVDAGDTILYTFVVENTGTVTLDPVTVGDPKVGAVTCPVGEVAPGATVNCDAVVYALTQTDLDAGRIVNTATASGTPPAGDPVTGSDTVTTAVPTAASLTLDKQEGPITDANGNGRVDAGDTITYGFAIQNTGTVTLDPVTVSDPKVGAVTCPAGPVTPGTPVSCGPVTYTLTQADVDAGVVNNTATAAGTPPTGDAVTATDSTSTPIPASPSVELEKRAGAVVDANGSGRVDAGDTIAYTFTATNTGTVTLDPVTVSDPMLGGVVGCPAGPLAPGAAVDCGPAVHALTQANLNAGQIENTAGVVGVSPAGTEVVDTATITTPVPQAPSIELDKRDQLIDPDGDGPSAGDSIRYTFVVANAGTVTLDPVTVSDPMLGGTITCPAGALDPGATITCGPADHVISQQNIEDAAVTNTATAVGTPPSGPVVTGTDSTTTSMTRDPRITIEKSAGPIVDANGNGAVDAGDTIDYSFLVRNPGNVLLNAVTVDDPLVGSVTCPPGPLMPGASVTCGPVTYTLTSGDIAAAQVTNTATVTGTPTIGDPVTDSSTITTPVHAAAMDFDKQAGDVVDANGDGRPSVGDTITYGFTIRNTGNVPLDPVTVSDPLVGAVNCPAGPLAPDETRGCGPVVYTLTAADIAAAQVVNNATATGTPPGGSPVMVSATTTTPVRAPALGIDKRAGSVVDANGSGGNDAGDTITYTFVVTNTGNLPVADITVGDPRLAAVTCPADTLDPGASMTCTAPAYVLTDADLDTGQVVNQATVSGTASNGVAVNGQDSVTVATPRAPAPPPAPAIDLVKTADPVVDRNGNGLDAGDTITFRFQVTNTGNIVLDDIRVADPKVAAVTCPATSLAPGATMTCVSTPYRITIADLNRGRVDNTAMVRAAPPGLQVVVKSGSTVVPIAGRPRLTVTKTANRTSVRAGGLVTYTIRVRNTGRGAARNVQVCDLIASNVSVAGSGGGRLRAGRLCFAPIRTLGIGRSTTYRVAMRVNRATRTRTTVNRAVAQAANASTAVARRTVRVHPLQRSVKRVPVTG